MKNLRFTILLYLFIAIVNYSIAQDPRSNIKGDYLLKTQWGDQYNCKYTPGNTPLGCHSLAIAQVLFYHKLAPAGSVSYQCSNGQMINEDFSAYSPDWNKMALKLTESTPKDEVDATSFFNYAVAVIVQKDFSTDKYIDGEKSNNHKTQVEKHFKCKYESSVYMNEASITDLFKKGSTFEKVVKQEIDAKRPLGFYYNWDKSGHAIVIDGYTINEGQFYVHANYGWFGHSDGWFLLPEDLPKSTFLVMLLLMEPIS